MNNNDIQILAREIAQKHNMSASDAENFVRQLFGLICDALDEDKIVKIRGFGTFKVIDTKDRESVDINTGERITIGSRNRVTFTPDNLMKELVNKPFSQFESVVLNDGVDFSELDNPKRGNGSSDVEDNENGAAAVASATMAAATQAAAEAEKQESPAEEHNQHAEEQHAAPAGHAVLNSDNEGEKAENEEDEPAPEPSGETDTATADTAKDDDEQTTTDAGEPESKDMSAENDSDDEERAPNRSSSRLYMALMFIMVGVIMFGIGYFAGTNDILKIMHRAATTPKLAAVKQAAAEAGTDTVVPKDNVPAEETAKAPSASPEKEKANTSPNAEPNADTATAEASEDPALASARNVVKHGAYTIVGTKEIIRVRKGMNLKKISKAYFGDGMECYLQVHNGAIDIPEGEKIKIPELKIKKLK